VKITLLGTGTPTPSLKRMSSGYMVEIGNDVILFDHGPGAYHRMMEAGTRAVDVTHVFFSHLHYDHCLDYIRLLMTRWDQSDGTLPELKVYGPPHIKRFTELLISPDGVFGPDLDARINHQLSVDTFEWRGGVPPRPRPAPEITELRSGNVIQGDGWRIQCASVPHVQPQLICYGMGHLELAELGRKAKVRNLVVSHILEQMDVPGVRERLIADMAAIYPGNLFFGEDLMVIPVDPPAPAKML
jgi:ribonuclease BN (tRNA processing enzyme)